MITVFSKDHLWVEPFLEKNKINRSFQNKYKMTLTAAISMFRIPCPGLTATHNKPGVVIYKWPSRENMFSFAPKHCLPPPYGCNPRLVQPPTVKQMAAYCCFTLLPAVFFFLIPCDVICFIHKHPNEIISRGNNALSARFTKIYPPHNCVMSLC